MYLKTSGKEASRNAASGYGHSDQYAMILQYISINQANVTPNNITVEIL